MVRRSNARRVLFGVAILVIATVLLCGYQLSTSMDQRSQAPAGTRVQVRSGASLRGVLAELARVKAVQNPRWVEGFLRLQGQHLNAQAGTYELLPHASVREILGQLNAGQVVLAQVTVVEGWTLAQMRAALNANRALRHEWQSLSDVALMSALGQAGVPAEGRFFPDTYRFADGTSDGKIYEMALRRMNERLQQEWGARAPGLPVAGPTAALILASIVEKETGREDERGKVSAVFNNRLRIGMRLQSDPTIIYGLGAAYDGDLRLRDLRTDGPYNSYTRAGLPPTPIALPGGASLRAVLHPADSDALYFVATGLGDGSHHFSTTYAEHKEALQNFLRRTGAVSGGAR